MFKNKYFFILALVFTIAVIMTGLITRIGTGDEIYHFRFAQLWYETGVRPIFDPFLESNSECVYYFDSDPLWAMGLVGIWKIIGMVSIPAMQIYQGLFYGGLIIACYLLGNAVVDKRVGILSGLIAATMPFFVAYSIFGYLDVPSVFFIVLGTYFLVKRKLFWSGLLFGLSFIAKRNSWLLIPPLGLFLIYDAIKNRKFLQILKFIIPAGLVSLPELIYKYQNWGSFFFAPYCGKRNIYFNLSEWSYTPSNILYNPLAIPQYLGIMLLFGLLIYIFYKKGKESNILLWLVIVYFVEYFFLFYGQWAVRYAAPVYGLISVLAAIGLDAFIKKFKTHLQKIIVVLVILGFLLQFSAVLYVVYKERQISDNILEAYTFVKEQTPEDTRILDPEYTQAHYTNRKMIWIMLEELPDIFWKADESETIEVLDKYGIEYIFIEKDRIYDDTDVHHRLGFPQSFVKKLSGFNCFEVVFSNSEVEIWQMNDGTMCN